MNLLDAPTKSSCIEFLLCTFHFILGGRHEGFGVGLGTVRKDHHSQILNFPVNQKKK
jgi:hypothetical protein